MELLTHKAHAYFFSILTNCFRKSSSHLSPVYISCETKTALALGCCQNWVGDSILRLLCFKGHSVQDMVIFPAFEPQYVTVLWVLELFMTSQRNKQIIKDSYYLFRFQRSGGIDQDFNNSSNSTVANFYYLASDHLHPGNESIFDLLELHMLRVNARKLLEVNWE